jgi:hypothetical protein
MPVFARFLAMGAAASLLVVATAGSAGATSASIWQVLPSENPPATAGDEQHFR